jgi:hypothetical protein
MPTSMPPLSAQASAGITSPDLGRIANTLLFSQRASCARTW